MGSSDNVGFIYASGSFQSIVVPYDNVSTVATGISNSGAVVGLYTDASNATHGFVLENSIYSNFDVPMSSSTAIRGISENGRYIAGTFNSASGEMLGFALDRTTGQLTEISRSGSLIIAQGVNSNGQVVGSYVGQSGPLGGGFIFDLNTGVRTDFPTLAGMDRVRIRGINDAGHISGYVNFQAFAGPSGDPYVFPQYPNASSSWGYDINSFGTIVGWSSDATTGLSVGWISSPVPETSSFVLWSVGAMAMGISLRRRQNRALVEVERGH